MARRKDDDEGYQAYGYGTQYLTPGQRITEERLAPSRFLEESMRTTEALAAAQPNPLLEGGPQLVANASAPVAAPSVGSNPLNPPVPLSVMGTDQRIAWETLAETRRAQQDEHEAKLLASEVTRRNKELADEQRRQSTELMTHIPKLREALTRSPDEYLALKADLTSRLPIGSTSVEANRVIGDLDTIYNKREASQAALTKAELDRKAAAQQKRIDEGYKEAGNYGADVVREYAARVEKDPDDANKFLAGVQQQNIRTSLEHEAGIKPEEIAQTYGGGETGRPFEFQAAQQALKRSPSQERNRANAAWAILNKQRVDSRYNPNEPNAFAESNGWTQQLEDMWQSQLDYANSLVPQLNRAGVVGAREGESMYRGYGSPAQVAQQPAGTPPVAPPQRIPVNQQKPLKPPLNPKYPEQWVGGKRYVQMPDGKLYLSKIQ